MIKRKIIEQMIRVDHAGEYGAVQIYSGQLKALGKDPVIEEMLRQEEQHFKFFSNALIEHKIRPTKFSPLWKLLGYSLGFISAKAGRRAAMACTIAVEETIDEHYQKQVRSLKKLGLAEELAKKIEEFRLEELEHRDIGLDNHGKATFGYNVLSGITSCFCKLAIFISKNC